MIGINHPWGRSKVSVNENKMPLED
jgi:hypothetical protein